MHTILILDEDASIQLYYEEELMDEGYEVLSEYDGADLGEWVLGKRPDLVIVDFKFGAGSSFDVLKELKTKDWQVPVLLCTTYDISLKEARAMGADDVVIKSSDLSELKIKIKKVLNRRLQRVKYPHIANRVPSIFGDFRVDT